MHASVQYSCDDYYNYSSTYGDSRLTSSNEFQQEITKSDAKG